MLLNLGCSSRGERLAVADVVGVQAVRRGPSGRPTLVRQEAQNGDEEQTRQLGAKVQRDIPLVSCPLEFFMGYCYGLWIRYSVSSATRVSRNTTN